MGLQAFKDGIVAQLYTPNPPRGIISGCHESLEAASRLPRCTLPRPSAPLLLGFWMNFVKICHTLPALFQSPETTSIVRQHTKYTVEFTVSHTTSGCQSYPYPGTIPLPSLSTTTDEGKVGLTPPSTRISTSDLHIY